MALRRKRISRAKNSQSTIFSRLNREIYKKTQFVKTDASTKPIDLWYERPNYGIVNHKNQPVYLHPQHLKQITSDEGELFVLKFVADAFEDFKSIFLRERALRRVFETKSKMLDLNPVRAWMPARNVYSDYLQSVYLTYLQDYYPINKKGKEIETFTDFVKNFITYIRDIVAANNLPFTLSSFLMNENLYILSLLLSRVGTLSSLVYL